MDNYDYGKLKFIAFLLFFNKEKQDNLIFNDNIKLRKVYEDEHDDFMENYPHIHPDVLTHVLEINVNENILDIAKKWYDNHRFEEEDWEYLSDEDKEFYIKRILSDYLENLINSINIVINIPISIQALGKYVDSGFKDFWEFEDKFFASFSHEATINDKDVELINNIFKKSNNLSLENKDGYKNNWWLLPFDYFEKYSDSSLLADQVIYLNIVLESLLSANNENNEIGYRLRFRSALYLSKIAGIDSKFVQNIIKETYNFRSRIVHGNSSLDEIENANIKRINEHNISLRACIFIFQDLLRIMLKDAILNHAHKSKNEFIEYIDTICNNNQSDIPYDLEEIEEYWDKL